MSKKLYKFIIYLGDTDKSVAMLAKSFDSAAFLLDKNNYNDCIEWLKQKNVVVYTSLGDLPSNLETVIDLLSLADEIVYCPPEVWSDGNQVDFVDPGSSIQGLTEIILSLLPDLVKVKNFSPSVRDVIPLVDQRKTENPQIWNAGCSLTHGVGLDPNQRYGQLLANELRMPCSFLSKPGSAIDWAADQILRSDIRQNDIVVWGLTSPTRLTYIHNDELLPGVTLNNPDYKKFIDTKAFTSQNTIYKHLYSIFQVMNFCKKNKSHLVLIGLLPANYSIHRVLKSYSNYITVPYRVQYKDSSLFQKFLDFSTDNEHPGPQQHNQYKDIVLKKLKQLEII